MYVCTRYQRKMDQSLFHQQTFEKLSMTKCTTCSGCNRLKRKCAIFISETDLGKFFMTTYNIYIAVVTASKQTCGNFEVRCPHLFGILLQCRLQASIKCSFCQLRLYPILCLFQDVLQAHLLRLRFYRLFPLS